MEKQFTRATNLHEIETHKRHARGMNEEGHRWLYMSDYDLGFIETPLKRGGKMTHKVIQSKTFPHPLHFPIFDLLTIEQVQELIQNNLP